MRRVLVTSFIVVLTVGWVVPAYLTGYYVIQYFDTELSDILRGYEPQYDFPFILYIQKNYTLFSIWFFLALTFWAAVASWKISKKENYTNRQK